MKIRLIMLVCAMLFFSGCQSTTVKVSDTVPRDIEGIKVKITPAENLSEFKFTSYYRNDTKILEKVEPVEPGMNTIYKLYLNNMRIYTIKSGPVGTEFRSSDHTRNFNKAKYTVKMEGDQDGRINRITIYTDDFKHTIDGFWFRNSQVIPWSDTELRNWKLSRNENVQR